jgi:hypothetical protein
VKRYAEESALCEYYLEDLTVFNDPEDDEYEETDGDESAYYLGEIVGSYWIFKGVAGGDPAAYLRLYYDAYTITYHKERRKLERRINGR